MNRVLFVRYASGADGAISVADDLTLEAELHPDQTGWVALRGPDGQKTIVLNLDKVASLVLADVPPGGTVTRAGAPTG